MLTSLTSTTPYFLGNSRPFETWFGFPMVSSTTILLISPQWEAVHTRTSWNTLSLMLGRESQPSQSHPKVVCWRDQSSVTHRSQGSQRNCGQEISENYLTILKPYENQALLKANEGFTSKETVVSSRCGVKHESFISKELVNPVVNSSDLFQSSRLEEHLLRSRNLET